MTDMPHDYVTPCCGLESNGLTDGRAKSFITADARTVDTNLTPEKLGKAMVRRWGAWRLPVDQRAASHFTISNLSQLQAPLLVHPHCISLTSSSSISRPIGSISGVSIYNSTKSFSHSVQNDQTISF